MGGAFSSCIIYPFGKTSSSQLGSNDLTTQMLIGLFFVRHIINVKSSTTKTSELDSACGGGFLSYAIYSPSNCIYLLDLFNELSNCFQNNLKRI